jgi:hypothetical protein
MSIQAFKKSNFFYKIKNVSSQLIQGISRCIYFGRPKVFFRYRTDFTHPSFDRFYHRPPLRWANAHNYELAHWINYPAWINQKPFIIEINDHPLSTVTYKNRLIFEPVDVLNHIQDAKEIYMHEACRIILLTDFGMEAIFKKYFGQIFDHKIKPINCPGCLPKYTEASHLEKIKLGVACLASDYELKGVDLVLKAWECIENKGGWKLYLACPNIPLNVLKAFESDKSIVFINKAPLGEFEKDQILRNCSITVAPTHIHGGANIVEGMEYGHAIVHFATHSTGYDEVGKRIEVPHHFYEPNNYGVKWKTIQDFKELIKIDKKNGYFDSVFLDLANEISSLMQNFDKLLAKRTLSLNAALGSHSLKERNRALKLIYEEISRSS